MNQRAISFSPSDDLTEDELQLAVQIFCGEWARIYGTPPHYPGIPLGRAIEAIIGIRKSGPI
jgi:hypothetical protein